VRIPAVDFRTASANMAISHYAVGGDTAVFKPSKLIPVLIPVLGVAALIAIAAPKSAHAIEAYSASEQQQFMDWCTGAKSASESTCSCALKKVAATVPAATLTQYLASLSGGQTMSFSTLATSSASMTATTVATALTTCGN